MLAHSSCCFISLLLRLAFIFQATCMAWHQQSVQNVGASLLFHSLFWTFLLVSATLTLLGEATDFPFVALTKDKWLSMLDANSPTPAPTLATNASTRGASAVTRPWDCTRGPSGACLVFVHQSYVRFYLPLITNGLLDQAVVELHGYCLGRADWCVVAAHGYSVSDNTLAVIAAYFRVLEKSFGPFFRSSTTAGEETLSEL